MPLVSIVLPAHNPGNYIVPTIESVIAQSFKDWEIIVVDDGSTEDLSYLGDKFPFIRLLREPNRGASIARNLAILASTGEFIAYLDADDLWAPTKLQRQMDLLAADPALGMCHTRWDAIDSAGTRTREGNARPIESYVDLLQGCDICTSSVLLRKSALSVSGLFDPFYKIAHDYEMWLKISRHYKIGFLPSCETLYRIHDTNITRGFQTLYRELVTLLGVHAAVARNEGNTVALHAIEIALKRYRSNYGATAFQKCRESLRRRDWRSFLAQYRFAFRLMPGFVMASTLRYLVGMR
jgi:glycosyltransferase involved in cell wall biosynthesis